MRPNLILSRLFAAVSAMLAMVGYVSAEPYSKIRFEPIPSDILPSSEVRKLYQDSDGYIWIPTYNGLARYDGYGVVTYGMHDVSGVAFNSFVNVVAEDRDKVIWIGTERGLFRLDKKTGTISATGCEAVDDCNISVIICDTGNGIWVGSDKGLFRKNASEHYFRPVTMRNADGKLVTDITSVVKDANCSLWVASYGSGLLRYDLREERTYTYDDEILRHAHVVFCDADGNVWVGTWGAGLIRLINPYAPGRMQYARYMHREDDDTVLLDDIVYAIEEDITQNTLWVGTRSGLSILHDPDHRPSFQNFKPGEDVGDLPYNEVNSIMRARDNLMWIGMLGGGVCKIQTAGMKFEFNRLDPVRARFNTSSVRSMYYIGEGEYWLGLLDFGLIRYNTRSGRIVSYREHPDLCVLPYTSTVNAIIRRNATSELCFATWSSGVWCYDEKRHRVRQINRNTLPLFADDCVLALREDPDGNLWIGSRSGIYIESASGQLSTLDMWLGRKTPFASTRIFDICCVGGGVVWIATNGDGIIRVDTKRRDWIQYRRGAGMTADNVYCLGTDDAGNLWAGTIADGLAVYSPSEDRFKAVTAFPNIEKKGITNIARDENGRMWITTNDAVFSFSPDENGTPEHINTYIITADLQSFFFNRNASARVEYGRMAFGGSNGLRIFTGNRIQPHQSKLPIVLTDFRVHNQSLRTMPEKEREHISSREIDYADEVTLTHRQNNFYIEFSMLSYANPMDNIFKYKLDGFDKEYVLVDSQHRFASYNNLPAGIYTFHLQAAGGNGVWSSNERVLKVRILPAPWRSWWAVAFYLAALAGVAYGAIRFLRYRLRMQHEIRISKFERRKTEELNHAKLQFFTNVTHELMTPLTIIITSLDSLRSTSTDREALYNVISVNATRLMRLIQQILEFRKVESGNLKIRVSQGDVAAFVRKCVEAFAPLVSKKRLRVYFQSSADRIEGWFDSDKLDKIVYNLLSNAAKYTPDEGEIKIRVGMESPGFVGIMIANSGECMSQQTIDGLFKRFYDGNYRKFHTIGTGIGLSLVKDLTDIHKGHIRVSSSEREGNCFRVVLPIGRDAYSGEEVDESVPGPDSADLMPGSAELPSMRPDEAVAGDGLMYTILIVDDNEELRVLVSNLLAAYFHIEMASGGEEALQLLAEKPVDLVVSDIMMPGMDGIELCAKIKGTFEYCHIPVILLTAKNTDDSRIEGYDSGADGYVTKPFNFKLLHAQIVNQLRKQERKGSHFRNQLVFEIEALEYTSMDEDFMRRAMACVNAHIDDGEFSQADFTREMNTSRTVLTEKLKSLTGLTPTAFMVDIRLRAAYRLLEQQRHMRIADLAYAVGFNDPKYFSTCFRKKFGISPKEFIEQLEGKGEKIV